MALYGYARVSTEDQRLDRQAAQLAEHGVPEGNVFFEKRSGRDLDRPELQRLLATVGEGDSIVVASLDRLGRSTTDLIALSQDLNERGVELVSLKESIDTTTAMGRMFFRLMADLAEFERELISERTIEGLRAAEAKGHKGGRPRTPGTILGAAMGLYENSDMTLAEVAAECKLSVSTVQREARRRGLSRRAHQ